MKANDADVGDNAKLVYRLLDNTANRSSEFDSSPFAINPASGVIRATASVDREVKSVYRFHVTAADAGSPSSFTSTALVTVNVLDVNDEAPQFEVYFSRTTNLFTIQSASRTVVQRFTVAAGARDLFAMVKFLTPCIFVSDIAVFVLKRDVKLQLTN